MALNEQDIARIANLARLELSQDESKRMLAQLNNFFGIVIPKCQRIFTFFSFKFDFPDFGEKFFLVFHFLIELMLIIE